MHYSFQFQDKYLPPVLSIIFIHLADSMDSGSVNDLGIIEKQTEDPLPSESVMNAVPNAIELEAKCISN
jgi:hypothetical protein